MKMKAYDGFNDLASLGHRKIVNIAGPQQVSTGFMRYKSFERYSKDLEISGKRAEVAFARTFSEEEGERCAEELLARGGRFTAVVCANDQLAIGAIAAFQRLGRSCPGDISVTGFNDMPLVGRLQPSLTTIRTQHHKLGVEAAHLIVEALRSWKAEQQAVHVVLPVELVVRASTMAVREPPLMPARYGQITRE